MNPQMEVEVISVSAPCADVRVIELVGKSGRLPSYGPGSHVNVYLTVGNNEIVRSYSLVGIHCDAGTYRIAVRHMPASRGGSAFMCQLLPGATLRISQPVNNFALSIDSAHKTLLAGGIGITPMIGMAQTLARQGADFRLYYAGRNLDAMPFVDHLREDLGERLYVGIDQDQPAFDIAKIVGSMPNDGELYVCGPAGMLAAAQQVWGRAGRDPSLLRFETFANTGSVDNKPFRVLVPRLNMDFQVPSNATLLETLERNGARPLFNCRKGECGLCAVEILKLDGTVDHRDVFFSPDEKNANAAMCSCVSRLAGGTMVIDFP